MLSLSDCRTIIEAEISKNPLLQVRPPHKLYEPLHYILSLGGKRIRPGMVLLANNLFSDDHTDAVSAAVAIEVFHNFTLLHDDIMDKSDLRRGHPSVHKKWNENIAILSGDAMAILSYQLLAQTKSENYREILETFNKLAIEVCEGQQMDMDFEIISKVSLKDYLKMIELKTSVLIAGSLKIGALIANAGEQDAQYLYEFGQNIGLAFQIQDDYLDVFGNPNEFKKVIGGDILANKKTYLAIKAQELANKNELLQLHNLFENQNIEKQEKINLVTAIYRNLHIDEHARKVQEDFYSKAFESLDKVEVPEFRKKTLKQFAQELYERKH